MKKLIRLTEEDLHNLIKDSVKKILKESKRISDMIFISYGTDKFMPNEVKPINVDSKWSKINNKPQGGLWASPLNSQYGWADMCNSNSFRLKTLSKHFIFKLKPNAKIYIINDIYDLEEHIIYDEYTKLFVLDIKTIVQNYDGIFVTHNAVRTLRYNYDMPNINSLYAWDVESICIFNPNVVVPIEENAFEKAEKHGYEKPLNDPYDDFFVSNYDNLEDRKQLQMDADFERYRNTNLENSKDLFKGKHPGILAQMHGNNKEAKLARKFNGTIKSGL